MQDVRKVAQAQAASLGAMSSQLDALTAIERQGFERLSGDLRSGFNQVNQNLDRVNENIGQLNSVIRWGLEDLGWKIVQQTDVLKSIDQKLDTPFEIQGNELRQIAEKLYERGVMTESVTRFLASIEKNPLDYRAYVGLAHAYIAQGNFDAAKKALESSLPHAPSKEIDYRSYSYRLIGRIHFACEENINAVSVLRQAISLSPNYPDALYDYAQYTALTEDVNDSLIHLRKAIAIQPYFWTAAQSEPSFFTIRTQVDPVLNNIAADAARQADSEFVKVSGFLTRLASEIDGLFHRATEIDNGSIARRLKTAIDRSRMVLLKSDFERIQNKLNSAKRQINASNLLLTLEAQKQIQNVADMTVNSSKQVAVAQTDLRTTLESLQQQSIRRGNEVHQNAMTAASSFLYIKMALAGIIAIYIRSTDGWSLERSIALFFVLTLFSTLANLGTVRLSWAWPQAA